MAAIDEARMGEFMGKHGRPHDRGSDLLRHLAGR